MRNGTLAVVLALVASVALATFLSGPYVIDPLDMNIGGARSTSTDYTMFASTGQAGGAGTLSSTDYSLSIGFWPAATAVVTVLHVDADASAGANDGSSWCDAFLTVQDALTDAGGSPDDIWVADGSYMPDGGYTPVGEAHVPGTGDRSATFQLLNNVAIYGGFAGCGAPNPDERDIDANSTVLSGDLTGNDAPVACVDDSPDCDSYGRLCIDGSCIIPQYNGENSYHVVTGSGTGASAALDGL